LSLAVLIVTKAAEMLAEVYCGVEKTWKIFSKLMENVLLWKMFCWE
jgi:hypothetical protein